MNEDDFKLIFALRVAAKDLNIEITAPIDILDVDGEVFEYIALIKYFGSKEGTLICSENVCPSGNTKESFYAISILSKEFYVPYTRKQYIDMLTDWGWYGDDDKKPDWLKNTLDPN